MILKKFQQRDLFLRVKNLYLVKSRKHFWNSVFRCTPNFESIAFILEPYYGAHVILTFTSKTTKFYDKLDRAHSYIC